MRFNDEHRTLVAQLPSDRYAEVKTCLEAAAKEIPSEGDTPWDGRLADALLKVIRSQSPDSGGVDGAGGPSPFFVVAHVPFASLVDGSGRSSALAGELEHVGLIDAKTVQRIACDATVAVAVDDDVGHTMYEGRARRFPTRAQRREVRRRDRHCRFPGCTNVTFANVHHIVPWEPDGTTDLDNLVLALSPSPPSGAFGWVDHDGQCQRGAHHHRTNGSGHDVAPFAAVDQGEHGVGRQLTPLWGKSSGGPGRAERMPRSD